METLLQLLTPVLLFVGTFANTGDLPQVPVEMPPSQTSVEVGLYETSPRGAEGGFAMPASGCSAADPRWHGTPIHDCDVLPDISTDKPIIREGDSVTIHWDPQGHINCVLSSNLMALSPPPDGNVAGSRTDTPTGETSYSIVCGGPGNSDTVTVKILPKIQET